MATTQNQKLNREPDAVQILLAHVQEVLAAFKESDGDARKTYDTLAGEIPAFQEMPWNTFRTRLSVVVAAWQAGYVYGSDTSRYLEQVIDTLREELVAVKSDTGKIQSQILADTGAVMDSQILADTQGQIVADAQGQIVADTAVPKTLEGWSLNQHKRGYWRAFRRAGGKGLCVYLGMKLDPLVAREKLVAANARLTDANQGGTNGNAS